MQLALSHLIIKFHIYTGSNSRNAESAHIKRKNPHLLRSPDLFGNQLDSLCRSIHRHAHQPLIIIAIFVHHLPGVVVLLRLNVKLVGPKLTSLKSKDNLPHIVNF